VRLPLWAFRLAQHVRLGRLPYNKTWQELYRAAWDGGAQDRWIRRCLFHGFSAAQHSDIPTIKLAMLASEGCQ
jgi:hypothetical protein